MVWCGRWKISSYIALRLAYYIAHNVTTILVKLRWSNKLASSNIQPLALGSSTSAIFATIPSSDSAQMHLDIAHEKSACLYESLHPQRGHEFWTAIFRWCKTFVVGNEWRPSLHRKILILEGTQIFHSSLQAFSSIALDVPLLPSSHSSLYIFVLTKNLYAELIVNLPFFFGNHAQKSSIEVACTDPDFQYCINIKTDEYRSNQGHVPWTCNRLQQF